MLNKQVCKKCLVGQWSSVDEIRWDSGYVVCPYERVFYEAREEADRNIWGMSRSMIPPRGISIKDSHIPQSCKYVLEHTVNA